MGAAVGQDCALLEEVSGWINEKATVPVWSKMTPNITDITQVTSAYNTSIEYLAVTNLPCSLVMVQQMMSPKLVFILAYFPHI